MVTVKREVPRADLTFGRRWIELESTGELFSPGAGNVALAPPGVAYYMDETGFPQLLEPADAPTRDELERRRAAKVERRLVREAAAKGRRRQLRAAAR